MECFYELSRYTQEHWEPPPPSGLKTKSASLVSEDGSKPEPVKVIEVKTVGAYEVAVLSASDTGSLENWLDANRYSFPIDKASVIDAYIKQQWYFVAVKIDLSKVSGFQLVSSPRLLTAASKSSVVEKLASGELQPLQISFASDQCVFPLKISSVNGTPSEVQVYVLSPEPLVEKAMFEKKFPEVRRLELEQNAKRMQMLQRSREMSRSIRMQMHPEEGEISGPPVETNVPLNQILRESVPYEALLPYGEVTEKDLPDCTRKIPQLKGKTWWLTKQTWTFKPDEMRDLLFQPAAPAFAEDLAGEEGYYVAQNLARLGSNAVPALLLALQNTNPIVRIHAASALDDRYGQHSITRNQRVLDCLPVLLKDPEAEVRMDAAWAAGSDWNPKFAEPLINMLRDDNEGVWHAAVFALKRNYQGRSENLPALLKMLKDENLMARANALEVLGSSEVPIPREDILPLLSVTNMRVVSIVLSRLGRDGVSNEDLKPVLHNRLPLARLAGLSFLERLENNKEAIGLIIPLLRDPEKPVQGRAWRLLRQFTGQGIPQDQPDQWEQWWAANKITFMLADSTKAIALNPKDGGTYHDRGCVYYNSHDFTNALADFRKSCELGSNSQDYSYYRIWLIRARSEEMDAATVELKAYLDNRKTGKPNDWPSKVGRFLAGQLTESDFLKAAEDTNPRTDQEQHCEAYFYAGSKRLIEDDKTTATDYFKKCLATDVKHFEEYQSADAEMKFLLGSPTKSK
jgi:HEAT repeat protein